MIKNVTIRQTMALYSFINQPRITLDLAVARVTIQRKKEQKQIKYCIRKSERTRRPFFSRRGSVLLP